MSSTFDSAMMNRWQEAEAPFARNNYHGLLAHEGGTRNFNIIWRPSPVLLIAPHAVFHRGYSNKLRAESGTGGLVLVLGELLGASTMVRDAACFHMTVEEYFHEIDSTLAAAAQRGITHIIDLHGCAPLRDSHVAIGLGPAPVPDAAWTWGRRAATLLEFNALRTRLHGSGLRGEGPNTTATKSRAYPSLTTVQVELSPPARFMRDGTVGELAPNAANALLALAKEMALG